MTRSRLEENWINYRRQWNFCTNLLGETKQKYFCSLNMKDLNDNKRFWTKIKSLLSDKGLQTTNILKACVRHFLKTQDTSSLETQMKLQLQTTFTCMSITKKPKFYVVMCHAFLHLLLQAKQGQQFLQKKIKFVS